MPPLCSEMLELDAASPVDYEWDQFDALAYFHYAETEMFERFSKLTGKANIALALAVCEWIAFRLRPHSGDTDLDDYLEAGWAALIDPEYSQGVSLPFEDWPGPALNPLLIAIGIVNDAFYESDDDPEMEWRSCYAINLARYVLPSDTGFEDWLEKSTLRLETHHSWIAEGNVEEDIFADHVYQGGPVGRDLFNLSMPYDARNAGKSLLSLLAWMDPENEFLYLPDDLPRSL